MALDRTDITPEDDDGSLTEGTAFDAEFFAAVYDEIDAAIDGANAEVRSVALGGTGASTLTGVLKGNGTDAITASAQLAVADGGTGAATLADNGVLIGNGTGAIQATAVGTAGQVLTSNGAGSDPTFQDAAGGDAAPFLQWTALGNHPPASAYATIDTRNSHPVLDFDGSTDEEAIFAGVLPTGYAGGGLTCEVFCAFTSATSGSVRWQAAIERIDASSLDIDADNAAAYQSAGGTAPGTSGQIIKVAITFTDGAQMDSLAAGEAFRLRIRRDADGTSGTDDITTDSELLRVVLRETP